MSELLFPEQNLWKRAIAIALPLIKICTSLLFLIIFSLRERPLILPRIFRGPTVDDVPERWICTYGQRKQTQQFQLFLGG